MNEYFTHDSTAGTDARLMKLRSQHGNKYYGMYWLTLEWLYQNADAISDYDIVSLSFYIHETEKKTEEFIQYCSELKLFTIKSGKIYSERLCKHKEKQISKSLQAQQAVAKREELRRNERSSDDTSDDQSNVHPVEKSRVKKSREEKSITYMPDKEIISESENEFRQAIPVLSKFLGSEKRFTASALSKWSGRRLTFSAGELLNAFENLSNEPDLWKIKNNGFRSLEWWLHSDSRIEEMQNCHLKQSSSKGNFIIAS